MSIVDFLKKQDPSRIKVLSDIHELILRTDVSVKAEMGSMMGKEMIIYKESGMFKYGLACGKDYMTLHVMAIYASSPLHEHYRKLLEKAKFQKGCINFKTSMDMPLDVVGRLLGDSAAVNMKTLYDQFRNKAVKTKTHKD